MRTRASGSRAARAPGSTRARRCACASPSRWRRWGTGSSTRSTSAARTVAGDHIIEAYDAAGASLGLQSSNGYPDGIVDLAAEYGPALLTGFDLIGVNDAFRVSEVWFAPEPRELGGVAAFAGLAWQARRRAGRG